MLPGSYRPCNFGVSVTIDFGTDLFLEWNVGNKLPIDKIQGQKRKINK